MTGLELDFRMATQLSVRSSCLNRNVFWVVGVLDRFVKFTQSFAGRAVGSSRSTIELTGRCHGRVRVPRDVGRIGASCRGLVSLLVFGSACLTLTMTGCSDAWNAGPMQYVESESLTKEVGKANLAGKPVLQDKVRKGLASLFGDSPQHIRVPEGSGLPSGALPGQSASRGRGPKPRSTRSINVRRPPPR